MAVSVLCADIGTSSLKAAVITEEGKILAYSRQQFLYLYTDHAAGEWFASLSNAIKDIHLQNPSIKIDALCISGNGPTVAVPSGETIRWNDKVPECKTKSLFIPRLLAFKNKYPDIWNKNRFILSGPECLIYELTGSAVTILPEQRYTQAYWTCDDLESEGFSKEEQQKLAPFVFSGNMAGRITKNAAERFCCPLIKEGMSVYCGAPDFISALVGTNTLEPGKLCDRAGSSEGLNLCTYKPVSCSNLRTLPSVMSELWNASFLLPESGTRFSAFKNRIERELGKEIDFNTLVHYCITKENSSFTDGSKMMIETAYSVKQGIEILAQAVKGTQTIMPEQMIITGGQAKNEEWIQMKADITGMNILVPECHDAELIGDAVFAFTGMNVFSSIKNGAETLCKIRKIIQPKD